MATTTMLPLPRGAHAADPLWAQAAELERQFEGYKRRLAERRDAAAAAAAAVSDRRRPDDGSHGAGEKEEEEDEEEEVGRGRRYEAYVRRRDEKLRQGWLARMERKEAEVKALWARLDGGRHRPGDGLAAAASPAREQKPRSIEKPASPATPKCIPAMKLPRLRSATASPSPAAASPRLPSSRRASHPEPPTTPRKENRMPPPSTAATPRPLKTLSRTRSSLKDSSKEERGSVSSSSSSSVKGESPRPPRFQPPRASYDGGAGGVKVKQAAAPAPRSDADAAIAAARSRFHEQVVLAEIKTAAAVSPGPHRTRRSGNGVARASSPSVALGRGQVDFLTRLGNSDRNDVQSSEHSDAKAKNSNNKADGNGDGEVARSGDKLGDAEITGDSDTEPSYVYVKRDHEQVGDEEAAEVFEDTMASSPSSETMASSPSSETMAAASDATGTSVKESSGSLYSNVQSSFSHGSELDTSAAGSPLPTPPPSGGALSTEELLEADAAMLRMKREEADEVEEAEHQSIVFLPSTCCASRSEAVPVAGMPQSPMDTVAGLKRFLTFGKKNCNGPDGPAAAAAVVIERGAPPAADGPASQGPAQGDPINKPRACWSDAASDDLDSSYVVSPHVRSLQSFVPLSPARSQLKEMALPAKSPRVPRSFFSFSSFKNRGN
ncbi:serine/arginine repetitive matrix protein 1 [Triticum aestivum]|nr:serine/arginine repetitive matrix protein 1-like [Triticum aestivum]